jgi:transcriptional regulator GlxA family with amidase domain
MRSLFGMTPAEFIKESRLSRAATLLSSTDRPVSEIAWECGFDDLNYFGKCFKARFEQAPTAYRKNQSL